MTNPIDIRRENVHQIYDAVSNNIERENNLVNYRLQWMILLSAGILAAEGALSAVFFSFPHDETLYIGKSVVCAMMAILAAIALWFSIRSSTGVRAALSQLDYLVRHYYQLELGGSAVFEIEHGLPRPFGDADNHLHGHTAAKVFPTIVILVWILLFCMALGAAFVFGTLAVGQSAPAPKPPVIAGPQPPLPSQPTRRP